jgi:DNA repair exonuclease SbcCD ATPase subunit
MEHIMETKLLKLEIENIFGVKAMSLNFDGKSAAFVGPNEAGKTSALDSLALAIGQLKDSFPVRHGENNGYVEAEFSEFLVRKEWKTGKKTRWEITSKNGKRYGTPSELFQGFINSFSYRPDQFINQKSKDRVLLLGKAVGVDVEEYNRQKSEIMEERKLIGRDKKKTEGYFKSLSLPSNNTPDEPIDAEGLKNDIEDLREKQRGREKLEFAYNKMKDDETSLDKEIQRLEQRLTDLKDEREMKREESIRIKSELIKTPNYKTELEKQYQKLTDIAEINNDVSAKKEYNRAKEELNEYENQYAEYTQQLKELSENFKNVLSEKNLPDGLTIEDDELFLNGVAFDRLSTFQKLDIAMKVGMRIKADNEENQLRVLTLDASQYDETNRQRIIELAKENDYQVILEIATQNKTADIDDANVFYIEDGTAELINKGV